MVMGGLGVIIFFLTIVILNDNNISKRWINALLVIAILGSLIFFIYGAISERKYQVKYINNYFQTNYDSKDFKREDIDKLYEKIKRKIKEKEQLLRNQNAKEINNLIEEKM
jgi:hypothetical protein